MNATLIRRPVEAAGPGEDFTGRPLALALHLLGIEPFTSDSVVRYQAATADKLNNRAMSARVIFWSLAWLFAAAGFLTLAAAFILVMPWLLLATSGLVAMSMGSIFLNARLDLYYYWPMTTLDYYLAQIKPVPARVLETAKSVRRFCPEASCWVQYLYRQSDPFLLMTAGGEQYFVEVWDERDFRPMNAGT